MLARIIEENADWIMAIPGVIGVAEGVKAGKPCLIIYVQRDSSEIRQSILPRLAGYPVEFVETQSIRALPSHK